jgi:hypothetical protein
MPWAAASSVTRSPLAGARRQSRPSRRDAQALGIKNLLYGRPSTCCGDEEPEPHQQHSSHCRRGEWRSSLPGEFDLNAYVGQRTEADGYKRAGAIIGDRLCCDGWRA